LIEEIEIVLVTATVNLKKEKTKEFNSSGGDYSIWQRGKSDLGIRVVKEEWKKERRVSQRGHRSFSCEKSGCKTC